MREIRWIILIWCWKGKSDIPVKTKHFNYYYHYFKFYLSTVKQAIKTDRKNVTDIIARSFTINPTVLLLTRCGRNRQKYIRRLAEYLFDSAIRSKGVFLSETGNGVAICTKENERSKGLYDFYIYTKLVLGAIAIRRIFKILRHMRYLKNCRPKDGNYLHVQLLGVLPGSRAGVDARDLGYGIIKMAEEEKMPIYAETPFEQNMRVFERFGLKTYKHWHNYECRITIWFLRKLN